MKIINIKKNNIISYKTNNIISNYKGKDKFFVPSNTEWYNSVYKYNTNNIKHIPILDKISYKLINTYFNMYNKILEKRVGFKNLTQRRRWLSTRKIWINKISFKHTNDTVIINVHVYDRIFNIISRKVLLHLKKWKLNYKLKKQLNIINSKISESLSNRKIFLVLKHYLNNVNNSTESVKHNIKKAPFNNTENTYIKILKHKFKAKMKLLFYFKSINNYLLRYNTKFVSKLQNIISKYYRKRVILNIILLKNYYLSSDILTQILIHKTRNRDNGIYRTLKRTLVNIKVPMLKKGIIGRAKKEKENQSVIINDNLYKEKINSIIKSYNNPKDVVNKLNNKAIIGIRIQSTGRLTKRFKAQRAVKKIKYTGTIRNMDSSIKGLSTQMVRNNITSSLQFSSKSSRNRIGSFGIKGWINSA